MKPIADVKLQTLLGVQSRMYLGEEKGRDCPQVSQEMLCSYFPQSLPPSPPGEDAVGTEGW